MSKSSINISTYALIGLSVITLFGVSTMAYGAWIKYGTKYTPGAPVPKGDCLEMLCPNGCVENSDTGYIAYCCPGGGSCRVGSGANIRDLNECCGEDEFCDAGTCKKKQCIVGTTTYNNGATVADCGLCQGGTVVRNSTVAPDCKSCNETTWQWDNLTDYVNKDSTSKCCIDGVRAYDNTNCPDPNRCKVGDTYYDNISSSYWSSSRVCFT